MTDNRTLCHSLVRLLGETLGEMAVASHLPLFLNHHPTVMVHGRTVPKIHRDADMGHAVGPAGDERWLPGSHQDDPQSASCSAIPFRIRE